MKSLTSNMATGNFEVSIPVRQHGFGVGAFVAVRQSKMQLGLIALNFGHNYCLESRVAGRGATQGKVHVQTPAETLADHSDCQIGRYASSIAVRSLASYPRQEDNCQVCRSYGTYSFTQDIVGPANDCKN